MNTYLYIGAAVLIIVAAIAAYALYRTYKVTDTSSTEKEIAALNASVEAMKKDNSTLHKKLLDLEKNFTTFVNLFDKDNGCDGDVCPLPVAAATNQTEEEEEVEEPERVGTVPREDNPHIQLINSFLGMLSPGTSPNVEVVEDAPPGSAEDEMD